MAWAEANGHIVLTHDLDFGAVLAATQARGPSVVQVRTRDVLPDRLAPTLVRLFREHQTTIEDGALVVVREAQARVRILPLRR